ncbi:hypothetical protein I656_00111 [Geobacillus sp. WSUCF1]|nr:hypothetical protein I656_00111 [Geobacillus sp. WSUCF1]
MSVGEDEEGLPSAAKAADGHSGQVANKTERSVFFKDSIPPFFSSLCFLYYHSEFCRFIQPEFSPIMRKNEKFC